MSDGVKTIPDGYEGVTPYLICKNAEAAIEFYKKAFGAEELFRIGEPGMVGHAEMKISTAIIMLADEHPDMGVTSPESLGGSPVHLMIYVEDVDAFTDKAVAEGLSVLRPVSDQFYGDRTGQFKDPFGHVWAFCDAHRRRLPRRDEHASCGDVRRMIYACERNDRLFEEARQEQ